MRYVLEPLEPRYLLSGTPIVVNQLPDTTQTGVTNNQFSTAVKTGVAGLVQDLSYLGQQLKVDPSLNQTALPFLNQTVNAASQEKGMTFGQTLFSDLSTTQYNKFVSDLTADLGTGATAFKSDALATLLQADLLPAGSNETITDKSSGTTLDLGVSDQVTGSYAQLLSLGRAAEAFGIQLVQISSTSPAPDINVQSSFDVTFDLKVNLSNVETDVKNGNSTQSDFHFDPGNFEQVLSVNDNGSSGNPYLPNFGIQFGIIGAGEAPDTSTGGTYGINGAYSGNSTLELNDDITLAFKNAQGNVSTDLTLNDLPTAPLTSANAANYYSVDAPTSGTIAAGNYENQAQLNLDVQIYNDNSSADTNTNPFYNNISNKNDYIAALGGVTGQFSFAANGLLSTDPITVSPNNVQLASLARLTPLDIVTYAQEVGYTGSEINGLSGLSSTLPFLTTTAGQAYDFGTAINNAFVNALSTQSSVLIAANQPYTNTGSTTSDFSNFDGGTTFDLTLSGPIPGITAQSVALSVVLAADTRSQSIVKLQSDLQSALNAAWSAQSGSVASNPITVELVGAPGSTQLLELVSAVQGLQFALYHFEAPASNVINLGFNVYSSAQLTTGDFNPASANFFNYQLPGVSVQTSAINLAKFSGNSSTGQGGAPTAFEVTWVQADGSPLANSPTTSALVTIPSIAYAGEASFVSAVQAALQNAALQDGITDNGVQVKGVPDASGTGFDLLFYGGPNVASLTVKDVNTTDFPQYAGKATYFANFGTLTSATGATATNGITSTAPSFTLSVTSGGTSPTTTSYTVFVNGNLTNGLLNSGLANKNATDLANTLVQALTSAGALSTDATTGITVQAGTDAASGNQSFLQFSAANAGDTSSTIASFQITAADAGLGALNLQLNTPSLNVAASGVNTVPVFATIQEFASLLATTTYTFSNGSTNSLLASAPSFIPISTNGMTISSDSFNFPIQIVVDQTSTYAGTEILPTLTGQTFSFASAYTNTNGETISNLSSSDTASVNRQDLISFNFGFNAIKPIDAAEQLTASMPINLMLAGGTLDSELILQIMLDDGITHTITVSTQTASTNTSLNTGGLYGADGKAASSNNPGAGLIGDIQNAVNTVLGNYQSTSTPLVTVTLTPSDGLSDPVLNFISAGGSTTELLVTVPPYALSSTTMSNAAFSTLGFGGVAGSTGTTSTPISNSAGGTATLLTTSLSSGTTTLSVTRNVAPTSANGNQTSVTDSESVSTIVAATATSTAVLANESYFEITLPDGTQTTLHVAASDTSADNSLSDLVNAINLDIAANPALNGVPYALVSQFGSLGSEFSSTSRPKIIAYLANADGTVYTGAAAGPAHLAFQLNPEVYTASTIHQSWGLSVQSLYAEQDPNSAVQDLGLANSAVSDTTQSTMGLVSTALNASNFAALAASGETTANFDVSINGTSYVTLSVSLTGINSISGLVANINAAIAARQVTFNFNNNGPTQFPLADYLKAEVTGSGTQIILRLLDIGLASDVMTTGSTQSASGVGVYPVLTNATIVPVSNTDGTPNALTLPTTLGFDNDALLIGLHGSEGTISDASFKGTAQINYATAASTTFGSADFGFALFNIGSATLGETVVGTLSANTATTFLLSDLFVDLQNGSPLPGGATFGLALDNTKSYADLTLGHLSFPASPVQGLAFNSMATIEIAYGTATSGGITYLSTLPSYALTYTNTNGMQDLASITYNSIGQALLSIGNALVDYMSNDPAFSTKLYFITQNFLSLDSIGADFDAAVAASAANKPGSLELAPAALATALGLPTSALTFLVQQVQQGGVTSEELNIQFDWSEAVSQTLNLAIDIGGLANHTTAPAQVLQYLLDLYSISGSSSSGSLNVDFSAISQLNVDLTLISAAAGTVQTPESILSNPASGNFFETRFLLSGQNLQGTLPAGTNALSLSDGQVALDSTGQVAFNDTTYSLPSYSFDSTAATYNASQGTITANTTSAFSITNFAATTTGDGHFSNLVAVTDPAGVASGIYYLSQPGSSSADWVLTRYIPTVATATPLAVVTQSLAGDATYSLANGGTWTSSATGPLTIQGNIIEPTNPQGLSIIDLQNQADPTENGIYYVYQSGSNSITNNGTTTPASSWVLRRFIPTTFDNDATTTFNPSTTEVLAVSNAPLAGTYNSGTGNYSGTGTLVIDGYTFTAGNINGQVLLNGQDNLGSGTTVAPNGLYTLTALGANSWALHRASAPVTGVRYEIMHGTQSAGQYYGYLTSLKYAQLLEPVSYSYQIGDIATSTDTSVVLPYSVDVATTGLLPGTFNPGTPTQPATLTGSTNGSINSLVVAVNDTEYGLTGTVNQTGIDGIQQLIVGSLVLVKDQTGLDYQNGVYVVTSTGSTTTHWVLTRANFAQTASQLATVRVNVLSGTLNAGYRFIQDVANLNNINASGDNIDFSTSTALIYSNPDTTNWFSFNAVGGGASFLPLGILLQTTTSLGGGATATTGSTTLINRDLVDQNGFQLTAPEIQNFANEASQLNNDPAYLAYPLFQPLQLAIPSLQGYITNAADAVTVVSLPDLQDSFIPTNILDSFKDGFFLGDALDLALFTIQSAIDEAVAQDFPLVGTSLANYVGFVELFRNEFTTAVRQNLLANPLEPLNDIRNALWQTVGPAGLNLIVPLGSGNTLAGGQSGPGSSTVTESDIEVLALTSGGTADASFNLNDSTNTNTYGVTPQGQVYEKVPSADTTVAFAFTLAENYAPGYNVAINSVDLGDTSLGFTINNSTVANGNQTEVNSSGVTTNVSAGATTTGGVLLERKFVLNLGFGMTLANGGSNGGFFVFNPLENNTSNPFFAANAQPATQSMFDFGFKAMLTGDINSPVVVPFLQTSFSSTLNQLNIQVADGRLLDYLNNGGTTDSNGSTIGADPSLGDGLPSGFYGDVLYDINTHTTAFSEALNSNLAFTGSSTLPSAYLTLTDLRLATELGPEEPSSSTTPGVLSFAINADSDIDLMIQSQSQSLIPAVQADFIYDKRWGTGANTGEFGLNFNSAVILGLGNATIGAMEMSEFASDGGTGANSTVSTDSYFTTNGSSLSPYWRFDRSVLNATNDGYTFAAYQNLKVDAYDYLGGTLLNTIDILNEIIAPFRPFFQFMGTPIEGTSTFINGGLVLASLFPKFANFLAVLNTIDSAVSSLATIASETSANDPFVAPLGIDGTAEFGSNANVIGDAAEQVAGKINLPTGKGNDNRLDAYKKAQAYNLAQKTQAQENADAFSELPFADDDTLGGALPTVDQETPTNAQKVSALASSISEAGENSKFTQTFNKFQNGELLEENKGSNLSLGEQLKNSVVKQVNDTAKQNDNRAGQFSANIGLTSGAILVDALDASNLLNILEGHNANLLRIQLPGVSAAFTYEKTFPLPAFPPLQLDLAITLTLTINVNLGWDTNGFYFNENSLTGGSTPVSPFGLSVAFKVGVELNFVLVVAEVSITLTITINFFWQDITGTGELHLSDISYLQSHDDSLFYEEITGTITLEFSINIVIPIPLIGPITIPILDLKDTFTLFDVTVGKLPQQPIILGSVDSNGVLLLNSGLYASQRLFDDTSADNEIFNFYSMGVNANKSENILVEFDSKYFEEFDNVKTIVAYAGNGTESYDADPSTLTGGNIIQLVDGTTSTATSLTISNWNSSNDGTDSISSSTSFSGLMSANVIFLGGNADVTLIAGANYNPGFGESILEGGTRTSLLDAAASGHPVVLVGGGGASTLIGTSGGGDILAAGSGPDLLYGNGNNDTFYIQPGFVNDRVFATGSTNSIHFDGGTISVPANASSYVANITISPVTANTTFQFGPLVESAEAGTSTVFFATDPSTVNQLNSWYAGTGSNIFNVFAFDPNETLSLHVPNAGGANTYNVYLGNPKANLSPDGSSSDGTNTGYVDIIDPTGAGILNLTQTDATPVSYEQGQVLNGREELTYSTMAQVNIDAGDSSIIWGDPQNPNEYVPITGGTIQTGTIILVGNVELVGNTTLKLDNSLVLNHNIDITGTQSSPANLEIDLINPLTSDVSNFYLTNNAVLSISSGTYNQSSFASYAPNDTGYGTIYLNLPTGGVQNYQGGIGEIEATNGLLAINSRDAIGASNGNDIKVRVANLAARTTGQASSNSATGRGIYIYGMDSLSLSAYDTATGFILGLSTTVGDIEIDMAAGATLTYFQINAGGANGVGGNVTINADYVVASSGFNENVTGVFPEAITFSIPIYTLVVESLAQLYDIPQGNLLYSLLSRFFTLTYETTYYSFTETVLVTETKSVLFGGSSGQYANSIAGTGALTLENVTTPWTIVLGDIPNGQSVPANALLLGSDFLDSISTAFASLVIGRPAPTSSSSTIPYVNLTAGYTSPLTGTIDVYSDIVFHVEHVILQAANLNLQGSLHDDFLGATGLPQSELELTAYDPSNSALGTSLIFKATATYQATALYITSAANLILNAHYVSAAYNVNSPAFSNGLVSAKSTEGSIEVAGVLSVVPGHGSDIDLEADTSLTIDASVSLVSDALLTLIATTGSINQNYTSGTSSRIKAQQIYAKSLGSLMLDTDTTQFITLLSGSDINVNNLDDYSGSNAAVTLNQVSSTNGGVTLDNNEGDIDLVQVSASQTAPVISALNGQVTLSTHTDSQHLTRGQITDSSFAYTNPSVQPVNTLDVSAQSLTLNAASSVNLVSKVAGLTAAIAGAGATFTLLNEESVTVNSITTSNGIITLVGEDSLSLFNLNSGGANISINNDSITENSGSVITLGLAASSPAPAIDGLVDAGAGNVTIESYQTILGVTNENLITGSIINLTSDTGTLNSDAINVKVESGTASPVDLNAKTLGNGNINLTADSSAFLDNFSSQNGNITVASGSGLAGINFTDNSIAAAHGSSNVTLNASGTIEDKTTGSLILADYLSLTSGSDANLSIAVTALAAAITGAGNLTIRSTDSLNVEQATTYDGTITLSAGLAGSSGDNLTAGNIYIGVVTAGSGTTTGGSVVNLTSVAGLLSDLTTAVDPNYNFANRPPLLTASTLNATTFNGIDANTGLHTAISTLNASSNNTGAGMKIFQTGDILINNVELNLGGDFILTAASGTIAEGIGNITVKTLEGGANTGTTTGASSSITLTSNAGAITQALNGLSQQTGLITGYALTAYAFSGVDVLTNVGNLNAIITGSTGNVTVTQNNSVTLGEIYTPSGNFQLTLLAGAVTSSPSVVPTPTAPTSYTPAQYHITANDITITAPNALGTASQFINVYADKVDAAVTQAGGIFFHNYKIHTGGTYFNADQVTTLDGPISIISAGDFSIYNVVNQTAAAGNDINLTSTGGGNILLNFVGTGMNQAIVGSKAPFVGDVSITSDGNILAIDDSTAIYQNPIVNIVAFGVSFSAQTGIGHGNSEVPIITGRLLSAKTVTGDITTGNSSADEFFISDFSTGNGNLGFTMTGGGDLNATGFTTGGGTIFLTVNDQATLYLGTAYAVGSVMLTADHIQFYGGNKSIFGIDLLNIQPSSPSQYVEIDSFFASTAYERMDTLEIGRTAFNAFLTEFNTIIIGNGVNGHLTYMYYFLDPTDEGGGNNNTTVTNITTTLATPVALPLRRLFDYFDHSTLATSAATIDLENILDTPLNTDSDDDGAGFYDLDDSSSDQFGLETEYSPMHAFAGAQHQSPQTQRVAILDQLETTMAGQDQSSWNEVVDWVDVATVMTTTKAALATKVSWLGRLKFFLGL